MTPCPPDDLLAALVQRHLEGTVHAQVTDHVDECVGCRQLLIAAVRGGMAAEVLTVDGHGPLAHGTRDADDPATDGGSDRVMPGARDAIGTRVGRYVLRRLLGVGGMGRVYEAFDPELHRAVALKIIRAELAGRTDLADRLVRESRMMAKLAHPAVIAVHDVGRDGTTVFIAMELVRGETLGTYVRRLQPSWRDVVGWLVRAADGLAAAHAAGIVHRDLKPDNVLVAVTGDRVDRVVVTDFGIARPVSTGDAGRDSASELRGSGRLDLTDTGAAIGTPAYMPPEQLEGRAVDVRADLFAFAVTAWELLYGNRPFAGTDAGALVRAIAAGPPPLPRGSPPRGAAPPRRIHRALARALASRPDDRGTLAELRAELARAVAPSRRGRVAALAVTVAAVAALGALGTVRMLGARPAAAASPCDATAAAFTRELGVRHWQLHLTLAASPERVPVIAAIDRHAREWLATERAVCTSSERALSGEVGSCLEARRQELVGVVAELALDPGQATTMVRLIGDARRCARPAPGLLLARVPADPAIRHRVTTLRRQLFVAETMRDHGQSAAAIASATAVGTEASALWPPLQAEAAYVAATAELYGGDSTKGATALRDAAALAERVHEDFIAANVWTSLAQASTSSSGDPERGLEYIGYAAAAAARLGNPPDLVSMIEYTRGIALIDADRGREGETVLLAAERVARTGDSDFLPEIVQGLGYYYEDQLRYDEAIGYYRRALALASAHPDDSPSILINVYERLSSCLAAQVHLEDAERMARVAVTLAYQHSGEDNEDRYVASVNLASILLDAGRAQDALELVHAARLALGRILGERSSRYAEVLALEAVALGELDRMPEAAVMVDRACDLAALTAGAASIGAAECWLNAVDSFEAVGKTAVLLQHLDTALPILERGYGPQHGEVGALLLDRGSLRARTAATRAEGIADLERAIAVFERAQLEPGYLAAARWELGAAVLATDPRRARTLIVAAVDGFARANRSWKRRSKLASAWVGAHPGP